MPEIGPADIWFDPRKILPAAKNALMYPVTHPAETAQFGLSMAPGSGEAMAGVDAWNASGRASNALLSGNYGQAASEYGNMGAALLGAIPGAGVIARGTKRGAAWMDRNLPAGVNRLLDAAMPSDPQNTLNAIPAWHGSPHDFEEFKLDKIGTGEGAQAYGHGLYFAENPAVARDYQNTLAEKFATDAAGNVVAKDGQTIVSTGDDFSDMLLRTYNGDMGRALGVLRSDLADAQAMAKRYPGMEPKVADLNEKIAKAEALQQSYKVNSSGRLYHTELDVEPHDLLDWDKPLSEQTPAVADAMARALGYSDKWRESHVADRSISAAWHDLTHPNNAGSPSAAAQKLRDAGIPGIKYLDQGSRAPKTLFDGNPIPSGGTPAALAAEKIDLYGSTDQAMESLRNDVARGGYGAKMANEALDLMQSGRVAVHEPAGTSNYVIFDDKLVKVLKKE